MANSMGITKLNKDLLPRTKSSPGEKKKLQHNVEKVEVMARVDLKREDVMMILGVRRE